MKKVIFASLSLLMLASCAKEYNCECLYIDSSNGETVDRSYTIKSAGFRAKHSAKETCEEDGCTFKGEK